MAREQVTRGRVVHVLPDKMGGVVNIVGALLDHRDRAGMPQNVVLTHNRLGTDARFAGVLTADHRAQFDYALPVENLYSVVRRLRRLVPADARVLVSHDLLELAMLHVDHPGTMVVQMLHGDHDYYYDLAARHQSVIDVFVAYSRAMYDGLRQRLPERLDDIVYLPYGVTLPPRVRVSHRGPLRAVFCGRLEHGQKGVFDLPAIAGAISDAGIDVEWTVVGSGPDERQLREMWSAPGVTWRGPVDRSEVLELLPQFDVFVLPTRREGLPVALVEAMGAGLVPVVSDIASGVPELVDDGVTGFRPPVGDVQGFARAIIGLAGDRGWLERMSAAARAHVTRAFDPVACAAAYERLYAQWPARRRAARRAPLPYGSTLDQPWLPNPVVRTIRGALRAWRTHA